MFIANTGQPQNIIEVANLIDNTTDITYSFPYNIDQLTWNYEMNMQSFSTIGGRVKQLLSVKITTLALQGEAGSRKNLMDLYENFKTMQDNQNQNKVPMTLNVPSRNLTWRVWLEQMQLGWDVTTVTYPYYMSFEADQDVSGASTNAATAEALQRIIKSSDGEIGYNNIWNGTGSARSVNVNLPK